MYGFVFASFFHSFFVTVDVVFAAALVVVVTVVCRCVVVGSIHTASRLADTCAL